MVDLIEFDELCSTPYGNVRRRRYKCGNCSYVSHIKSINFCPACGEKLNKTDKRTKEYGEQYK